MTAKRKSPPPNLLEYLWNEFLFTRPFSFETPLPPEQCVAALERLPETVSMSYANPDRRRMMISPMGDNDECRFRAEHERYARKSRSYSATILAEGSILPTESGGAVVTGTARFAPSNYVLSVGIVVAMCLLFISPANYGSFMGMIMMGAIAWAWWTLYQERNAMIDSFSLLLEEAERTEHLGWTKPKETQTDVWTDNFPSQKANRQ